MRHPLGQKQRGQQVAFLLLAHAADTQIGRRPFDTVIGRQIVAMTVTVFLSIRLVMALVLTHQILQRETIVVTQEIDAGVNGTVRLGEDIP